jgi:tetratricopeptide (TPR) repeat protein
VKGLGSIAVLCVTIGALGGLPRPASALVPEEAFSKANALYADEHYAEALSLYKEIIDAGWEAPELYFNASNCYLRTGRPGLALVMCRRAQRLAPGDEDVRANLSFIKSLLQEGAPAPENSRVLDAVLAPHRRLSADGALAVASGAAFALAGVISAMILMRRRKRLLVYLAVIASFVLIASLAGFGAKLWEQRGGAEAVVVVPLAEVRSGPGEDFVIQTSLGEGAEVRIKRPGEQWTEVSLGPDLAGWVKSSELETI